MRNIGYELILQSIFKRLTVKLYSRLILVKTLAVLLRNNGRMAWEKPQRVFLRMNQELTN